MDGAATHQALALALVEAAPEPLVLVNAEGVIVLANDALLGMYGYAREELCGQPIEALIPEARKAAHVAHRRAFASSPPPGGAGGVLAGRRRDGAEIIVDVRVRPLATELGAYFVAVIRDITERERFETALLASEERFRLTFEESPIGMGMAALDGHFLRVNEAFAALVGCSVEELVGRHFSSITHPDDRAEDAPLLERLRRGEVPSYRREKRYLKKDGSVVPVVVQNTLVRDPSGNPLHFLGQVQDIAAQKELERLRDEWASVIAHDLRQPAHIIMLNARLAREIGKRDKGVVESADAILAAVRRLDRMIGDLLDFSRVEVHELPLYRVPCDLTALVRASVARVAPDAPGRAFLVEVRGDVPELSLDPDRIAQILDNLVGNAVKYGAPATPVTVTVERAEAEIAVAVVNEGPGIRPEDVDTLFQRFRRVGARRGGPRGVGLGLYITRGLIEAHGGRIHVESVPGATTAFRFTLPLAPP